MTYYEYINSKVPKLPSPDFIECNKKEILRHTREISKKHVIWNIVLSDVEAECDIDYLIEETALKQNTVESCIIQLGLFISNYTAESVSDDDSVIVLPFDAYTVEKLQRNDVTTIGTLKYMISSGRIVEVFDNNLNDVLQCINTILSSIYALDINDTLLKDLKDQFALYNINNLLTVLIKLGNKGVTIEHIIFRIGCSKAEFSNVSVDIIRDYLSVISNYDQKVLMPMQDLVVEVNDKQKNITKQVFTDEVCEGLM